MRKEDKIERGCLTLDSWLDWVRKGVPAAWQGLRTDLKDAGSSPAVSLSPRLVLFSPLEEKKSCSQLLIVQLQIGSWAGWAGAKPQHGEEGAGLDGYRARTLGAQEGVWDVLVLKLDGWFTNVCFS